MEKKSKVKVQSYDASSIKQLKGLEAVRARPAMFLGDPGSGDALHHCFEEIVANSVDEHLGGHCDKILVELLPDGWCTITDNGRGIPVDIHPEEGISALQLVMCNLSAGGKFDHDSYEKSAGLHGIGAAAVQAVSSACIVTVCRDGKEYRQSYSRGLPTTEVLVAGKTKLRGTTVAWQRDLEIFSDVVEYDRKKITNRCQELAFLNSGLSITVEDKRGDKPWTHEYCYTGGIKDYLSEIVGKKKNMVPVLHFFDSQGTEVAMTWTDADSEDVRCYSNNTFNADGGTHLVGFRSALTRLISNYAKEHNMLRGLGEEGITGSDVREGLLAVVSVKLRDIAFSSQTKDKLVTPKARTLVEDLFADQIAHFFIENPGTAKKIADRAIVSAKAREAARRARDQVKRKELFDVASLPGKLSDCQSKVAAECEIVIIEGSSAAGTTKAARDRRFQAVLPLRGKVRNVENVDVETILKNEELGTLITALGCGIEQLGNFDITKLRYGKILVACDADVDGGHIRALLLTFFHRCMPRLIHGGNIYIAMPPLYGTRLKGPINTNYFTGPDDLEAYRATLSAEANANLKITRYKGLGEMNAEALSVTTLDPETRAIRQVTVNDAIRAEQLFETLMGDNVESRRAYIEDNALYANLDI